VLEDTPNHTSSPANDTPTLSDTPTIEKNITLDETNSSDESSSLYASTISDNSNSTINAFSTVDSVESYKNLISEFEELEYLTIKDEALDDKLLDLYELYNNSSNFKSIGSFERFKTELWIDYTTRYYITDINNDGQEDYILAYFGHGTGRFAGVGATYTLNEGELEEIPFPDAFQPSGITAHDIALYTYEGMTYIQLFASNKCYVYYLWEDKEPIIVFDEDSFVNNDHLDEDYTSEKNRIKETYHIDEKAVALREKGIDHESRGCYISNEDLLTSLYRIKDYMLNNNKEQLSKMIIYPIGYRDDKGIHQKAYTPESFIEHYDSIVRPSIKKVVQAQRDEELFLSWRGAMIGDGEVWFTTYIMSISPTL